MPPAKYDEIVQRLTSALIKQITNWRAPLEGGLSKLWIGKCEDQPCAVALCRALDDAERRLPVIYQAVLYGSGTTVLRL